MTQQEILEYNKRCAEFLGSELKNDGQYDYWTYDHLGFDPMKIRGSSWISGNFEFHSDWNWIMEVVEAIEKLGFTTSLTNNYFHIMRVENNVGTTVGSSKINSATKIESIVQAINQFLIWYYE